MNIKRMKEPCPNFCFPAWTRQEVVPQSLASFSLTHTRAHMGMRTHAQPKCCTRPHTGTNAHVHTHSHASIQTNQQTHTNTHTPKHTHTHSHPHLRPQPHLHLCTPTHAPTHTHTHTRMRTWRRGARRRRPLSASRRTHRCERCGPATPPGPGSTETTEVAPPRTAPRALTAPSGGSRVELRGGLDPNLRAKV